MNPDSLPSFDEWRKEAARKISEYTLECAGLALCGRSLDNLTSANALWDALVAHLAAHPSAAPQGAQPASVAHIEVMPGGAIEYGLTKDAYALPEGIHRLYASPADAAPVVPQEVIELVRLTRDALTQCQANMAIGNAWHVAADAILQADQFLSRAIPAKEQK